VKADATLRVFAGNGVPVDTVQMGDGILEFETDPGGVYELRPEPRTAS
jgi:hypothetical protein